MELEQRNSRRRRDEIGWLFPLGPPSPPPWQNGTTHLNVNECDGNIANVDQIVGVGGVMCVRVYLPPPFIEFHCPQTIPKTCVFINGARTMLLLLLLLPTATATVSSVQIYINDVVWNGYAHYVGENLLRNTEPSKCKQPAN